VILAVAIVVWVLCYLPYSHEQWAQKETMSAYLNDTRMHRTRHSVRENSRIYRHRRST